MGGKGGKKDAELALPPADVLAEIDSRALDRLYVLSDQLDSEAVVTFVRTLCKIASEELRSVQHPRVFSLTKIVEISHFNMTRIRYVSVGGDGMFWGGMGCVGCVVAWDVFKGWEGSMLRSAFACVVVDVGFLQCLFTHTHIHTRT